MGKPTGTAPAIDIGLQPQGPFEVYTAQPSEIVIGLVGPLGTDNAKIRRLLKNRLESYGYETQEVPISQSVIPTLASPLKIPDRPKYERARQLIELGNKIRLKAQNEAVLALAASAEIARLRPAGEVKRCAYIISSLKHPAEVAELRKIYGSGFYLFAVHTDKARRLRFLAEDGEGMRKEQAEELITRDEHESEPHGQHTRDTFHLADFFLADGNNEDRLRFSVWRALDLIFGNPFVTPTFNEFAMFMAFAASLRSADLSRQVGAVIARDNEILSTGANDCPRAGGGLYWPVFAHNRIEDEKAGRDYKRGFDSNDIEKSKLIQSIVDDFASADGERIRSVLKKSPIDDLTEYGRVVHAEMEALLACARGDVTCRGGTVYCTTFPCHNCAKHIIAAGIRQVIYVEPYPKSKALQFHPDAATLGRDSRHRKVRFKPFVGVGPRQFFDLFSMRLSAGRPLKRKASDGTTLAWNMRAATPRVQMLTIAHREFEDCAIEYIKKLKGGEEPPNGEKQAK